MANYNIKPAILKHLPWPLKVWDEFALPPLSGTPTVFVNRSPPGWFHLKASLRLCIDPQYYYYICNFQK